MGTYNKLGRYTIDQLPKVARITSVNQGGTNIVVNWTNRNTLTGCTNVVQLYTAPYWVDQAELSATATTYTITGVTENVFRNVRVAVLKDNYYYPSLVWLSSNTADPLWNGLITYFRLDETSGTTAYDSVDTGCTMNHNGAAITTGKNNDGIDVQSGDYPRLNNNDCFAFSKNSGWTMSFWYNPSATGTRVLFDKQDYNGSPRKGYECYLAAGDLYLNFLGNGATEWWSMSVTNPMPSTSTWYHFVMTYGGGDNIANLKIYIDGVEQTINITANNIGGNDFYTTAVPFTFGAYWDNNYPSLGVMDELAEWNRELSSTEVSELYNSGNGKFY